MAVWDIDHNEKARQTLPVRLRRDIQYAWLKALLSPVVYLAGLFNAFRVATDYDVARTGQVCSLEKELNDVFDNTLRRIVIDDPDYTDPIWLYRADELRPVYLATTAELPVVGYDAPSYLYLTTELYTGDGVQFVVKVPAAITLTTNVVNRMKGIINRRRLPSKRNYTIVNV